MATLVVPAFKQSDDGATHAYAEKLQNAIAELTKEKPAGWIIDLRGNLGGNMWPMLAGLGSLAGDGPLGFFIDADGKKETWFYASDGSGVLTHDGKQQILCWTPPPRKVHFRTPQIVAVLIDRGTASSGEAIAIAFEGRPLSRSFGRHTHGQSTSNQGFALPDGANIVLTTGIEADRTGHVYPDGITPDAELPKETKLAPPGSVDPMTLAAAAWIKTMASSR